MTAPLNQPVEEAPTLEQLRREIDAIDDQLIDLLKTRIRIVDRVGRLKKSQGENGLFVRSGREGAMLRRIYEAFEGHDFNAQAAAAMWRTIISASIHLESPLALSVFCSKQDPSLYWLAREYFGGFVPLHPVGNVGQVLGDLSDGKANIGVLPYPDDTAAWWTLMAQEQEKSPKIFAHIPTVISATLSKTTPFGFAIGLTTPEPSGDDQSYFRLTLDDTTSTSRLQSVLQEAGLKSTIVHTVNRPPLRTLLLRIEGFHDRHSDAIEHVAQQIKGLDICWLGAHPSTIVA